MTAPGASSLPAVIVATGWREPAERAALRSGLDPRIVIDKHDCAGSLREVRRRARREGIRTVAIHSGDWDRQAMPQLFELAAARLRLPDRRIIDDAGAQRTLGSAALARSVASLPAQASAGVFAAVREATGLRRRPAAVSPARASTSTVLALWRGPTPDTPPGGAVTHVSGILSGFRRLGLRVVLVTTVPPPPQILDAIDELEVIPTLAPSLRLTKEIEAICTNRLERSLAASVAQRVRPGFVYMRYEAFMTSGMEVARQSGLPLVLEWNSSAIWTRANWQDQRRLKQLFDPLLRRAETYDVTHATLVAAVSDHAAAMAVDAGAPAENVIVVPNGVDLEAIDMARGQAPARTDAGPLVGWVGSFGPWHGAEVLVRALRELPADVRAVMVGDGVRRPQAQALARELGVDERIEWTGTLAHRSAVARLAACDVLASPHVPLEGQPFFGSPTKLFEYMAIGRPIVASALEQIGEVLEDGRTARLVAPGDVSGLAAGIADVLALPDRGASLGEAARGEAQAAHRWDDRARIILERLETRGLRSRESVGG